MGRKGWHTITCTECKTATMESPVPRPNGFVCNDCIQKSPPPPPPPPPKEK